MHMGVSTVRKQSGPRGPAFTGENDDGISSNDNDKEAAINDTTISFVILFGQRLLPYSSVSIKGCCLNKWQLD